MSVYIPPLREMLFAMKEVGGLCHRPAVAARCRLPRLREYPYPSFPDPAAW
jgi:hypothetical protein